MELLEQLSEAIIGGDKNKAEMCTKEAIDNKLSPKQILDDGLLAGMNVVGKKFKANEFYIPEVLIAARAMGGSMTILKPLLIKTGVKPIGKVVLGTVKGDLHDIGKNIVGMMLQGSGFEVIDIGVDKNPEEFIQAAQENNAEIIGLSALLTTTMLSMKNTVIALENSGLRDKIKVIIGGAPVTDSYATEIKADGYASDAASAVDLAKSLILN